MKCKTSRNYAETQGYLSFEPFSFPFKKIAYKKVKGLQNEWLNNSTSVKALLGKVLVAEGLQGWLL